MRLDALLFCISLGSIFAKCALGQDSSVRPHEMVRDLVQASLVDQAGLDPCSYERRYRSLADSLVALGAKARVDIERALDSIEQHGEASEFATNGAWVVEVYARIWGRDAFQRLQRMAHNPALAPLQLDLDSSIAISLRLTGFVSSAGPMGRDFPCDGITDRQDVLSAFIRAWQRNDRLWIERELGPTAKNGLHAVLLDRSWEDLRVELWPRKGSGGTAIGYRFENAQKISPRVESPCKKSNSGYGDEVERVEVDTQFFDGLGNSCGESSVTFSKYCGDGGHLSYAIDNSDIAVLMRLIAGCAVKGMTGR